MELSQIQFDVLNAVKDLKEIKGRTVIEFGDIAIKLNISNNRVTNVLDFLVDQGYLTCCLKQPNANDSSNFTSYLVEITNRGLTYLEFPDEASPSTTFLNQTFNAPVGIASISGGVNKIELTQNINQNDSQIIELIESSKRLAASFPEDERKEANAILDSLKDEIQLAEKKNPERIEAFLKILRKTGLALIGIAMGATAFADNAVDLAKLLGFHTEITNVQPANSSSNELLPPH